MKPRPNKTILITGATSGLGRATALLFARAGWHVVVGARSPDKARAVVAEIEASHGRGATFIADLSDLDDVRRALGRIRVDRLDAFVANAGVVAEKPRTSAQGYELTFAVNVLAHQLMAVSLEGRLAPGARVVFLSSGTHLPDHRMVKRFGLPAPRWLGADDLARPDLAKAPLTDGRQIYATSKLGAVLQARGLQHHLRTAGRDVDVFAFAPGLMPETRLVRDAALPLKMAQKLAGLLLTSFVRDVRRVSTSASDLFALVTEERYRGRGFLYVDGDRITAPSADALDDVYRDDLWRCANRLVDEPHAQVA